MKYSLQGALVSDIIHPRHQELYLDGNAKHPTHQALSSYLLEDFNLKKLTSLLVRSEPLSDTLALDPRFATLTNYNHGPRLLHEAMRCLEHHDYPPIEEVRPLIHQHYTEQYPEFPIHLRQTNQTPEDSSPNIAYRIKTHDSYYEGVRLLKIPEVLNHYRSELEEYYHLNHLLTTDPSNPLLEGFEPVDYEHLAPYAKLPLEDAWSLLQQHLCIPHITTVWERHYDLPPLLQHWDDRHVWQYYLVCENDLETLVIRGGVASSGARYNLGMAAHTAMHMCHNSSNSSNSSNSFLMETHYLTYTEQNKLRLDLITPSIKVPQPTFGCNYHPLSVEIPSTIISNYFMEL